MTVTSKIGSHAAETIVISRDQTILDSAIGCGGNLANTTISGLSYRSIAPDFGPQTRVEIFQAASGTSGPVIKVAQPTHWQDRWAHGRWEGADVAVFRVSNGAFSRVGETTVVSHRAARPRNLIDRWVGGFIRVAAATTQFNWRLSNAWRPGASVWVGLVGIAPDGTTGPASWQAVTLPSSITADATTPTAPTILTGDPEFLEIGANAGITAPEFTLTFIGTGGQAAYQVDITTAATGHYRYALIYSEVDPESADFGHNDLTLADDLSARAGDMVFIRDIGLQIGLDMVPAWCAFSGAYGLGFVLRGALDWSSWREDDPARRVTWSKHSPSDYAGASGYYASIALNGSGSATIQVLAARRVVDSYYPTLSAGNQYVAKVRIKGSNAIASLDLDGDTAGDAVISTNGTATSGGFPVTFSPSSGWQEFTVTFEVGEQDVQTFANLLLTITSIGGPASVDVSAPSVVQSGDTPGRLSPGDRARLAAMGVEHLRNHSTVRTQFKMTYDLERFISGFGYPTHYHLSDCAEIGCNPWMQPEFHIFAFGDARDNFAEYLCAPAGAGAWADLRVSLGQTAPWTTVFERLYIEGSNEIWLGLLFPSTFYGFPNMIDVEAGNILVDGHSVHGHFHRWMVEGMRSNEYYPSYTGGPSDKIQNILGSRYTAGHSIDAAARAGSTANIAVTAPYGSPQWETGGASPLSMEVPIAALTTLLWPHTNGDSRIATAEAWRDAAILAGANPLLTLGTYEDGPSSLETDGTWTEDERIWSRSKGAGQSYFEEMLKQYLSGYEVKSFFTAERGLNWESHSPDGQTEWPCSQWITWSNAHLAGSEAKAVVDLASTERAVLLRTGTTGSTTAYYNVPELSCPATFWHPDRVFVPVFNRTLDFSAMTEPERASIRPDGDGAADASDDGSRTVRLAIGASASAVIRHRMTGSPESQNYDDGEATYVDLSIIEEDRAADYTDGVLSFTLPPGECYVYEIVL